MNPIRNNIADDINRWHDLACNHAEQAIEHAKQAGALLLEVKQALPHGAFLPWVATHVQVSQRQAQRYIAASQGKPIAPRAIKNETVSDLTKDWTPRPAFIPMAGHWYWCAGPDGAMAYVIEPSKRSPGFFYVSHLYDEGTQYDCTRRPIAALWVETNLDFYGLKDAAAQRWHVRPSAGVDVALGTLDALAAEESSAAA